jgi:glycosyltransferase involved in cell wall biosynthesis
MRLTYSGERFMPGSDGPGIHLEHLHRYSLAAALVGGRVLDLGCGVGYGSRLLAGAAQRVVGIDSSLPAVALASEEYAAPNLDYLVGDVRALPLAAASFDWVVCFELIEHLQEGEEVVAEIARVLADDGKLLLSTPNRPLYSEARNYSNPFHVREFDIEELRALLARQFEDVVLFGQRLVAGSEILELGPPTGAHRVETLPLDTGLAPALGNDEGPIYLLALCGKRRGQRRLAVGESFMAGRLEAFIAEQIAIRREAETAIRAEYDVVLQRLIAQIGEFDARIRHLGNEIDLRHAANQEEVARFGRELAAERSRREALEAERDSWQEQAVARRLEIASKLAERDRQTDELNLELQRVRADLAWCFPQWQTREAELHALQQSKMWSLWMAYQAVRRTLLSPLNALRRAGQSVARGGRLLAGLLARLLARGAGWLYLVTWTGGHWLAALWRDRRLAPPEKQEVATPPRFHRRPRILLVCPYPLYPADHGGGVRIYNLLRRLARHCDFHLLVFIHGDEDPQQRQVLEQWVEKLYFHHWRPGLRPDLRGLKPPLVQLFDAPEVRALVNDILSREQIDILQLEYTELGQYGLPRFARVKVVLSEIDICFRSRARRRRAGMHRRYTLDRIFGSSLSDWMRQFRYELQVTRRADQVHVMSNTDGAYLARFLPDGWRRLRVVPNAVDLDDYRPPDEARGRQLLFVGNFEHLPNLDALDYLLSDVWPQVRRRMPDAELRVVGARAGPSVTRYDGRDGVSVVGAVPETRPYYQRCRALVAPIRAGSGTRLKILEALACATPVVTTTIGAEGIDGIPGRHFLIADTAAQLIDDICRLLGDDELCARLGGSGRELAEDLYSWESSAAAALAGYADLLGGSAPEERIEPALPPQDAGSVDVSVIIPTLNGGAVFERCLEAVSRQETERSVEIVCVDSGSSAADLAAMERYGARVIPIDRKQFNHGLTRDLGAAESCGRVLVFLNQDAVPCDPQWLETLVAPLFAADGCVAVQGGILEVPDRGERFYWDSCGDRFYFTRESKRWIERYFGIGFSTVNAAIRRDVWERHPFGYAPIMEDKKWQREVVAAGHCIAVAPRACVHHTHDYDMSSLSKRCQSEGFGWRTLGERYSFVDMLADSLRPSMYADLLRGLARGRIRSRAEFLFPLLRPWLLFRGNHWGKTVRA